MSNNADKWQRGGKIEDIPKKNKNNKKNSKNNKKNDKFNDKKYSENKNKKQNNNIKNFKQEKVTMLQPQILKPKVEEKKYEPLDTKYKNIVDNIIESEKSPTIDVKDPGYWNKHIWIGPVLTKMKKPDNNYSNYLKQATKYASTIVMPFNKIQYSRNGINWHNSFKETFTEEEWNNMLQQEFDEKMEKHSNKMEEKYNKELQAAYQEYYETGDMNTMVQVDIEVKEHEKYLERLEKEIQEYEDDYDFEDDEEFLN